jgi:hypothetical protein
MDKVTLDLIVNLMEQIKSKDKRITELEKMLNSKERELQQMVNKRLDVLEKQQSQQMNNVDKRVDTIITKNMKQVTDIQKKLFDKKYEELRLEYKYEDTVNTWINTCCEWKDDVVISEGYDGGIGTTMAPTEFDILYLEFNEWCEVKEYNKPPRHKCIEIFNTRQAASKYGLVFGKKKSDWCKNGTPQEPLYNIMVV